jgi:hypothetical protein
MRVLTACGWLTITCMATLLLAGCDRQVERVTMDTDRLVAPTGDVPVPIVKLACPYHIKDVIDARSDGDRVGGLGYRMFVLDDAPGLVRRQLLAMGLSATDAPGSAQVSVRILKFYLASNGVTKIPVVVFEVRIDQEPPFLIRSQRATVNWANTESEEYTAYARAFQDANAQLGNRLAQRCGKHA